MTPDDITRLAHEAWGRDEDLWLTHEQYFLERFFKLAYDAGRKAEQERCCAIVIGLAGSDNVAHRTVKAIRSDK